MHGMGIAMEFWGCIDTTWPDEEVKAKCLQNVGIAYGGRKCTAAITCRWLWHQGRHTLV